MKKGRIEIHTCDYCGLPIFNRMPSAKYHKECRMVKNRAIIKERKIEMQRKNKSRN